MKHLKVLVGLLLSLICAVPLLAQTVNSNAGAIVGTVTDETKSVLPGVTVTVTGPTLMGSSIALSDAAGSYRIPAVPPGEYRVTFELAGFRTLVREGIAIATGFTATVNVEMAIGSMQESLTVSGDSPVVDLQSVAHATNFDIETRQSLPGARDVWALMSVTPSVNMSRMDVGGSGAWTQQGFAA
jgi:Ca-activated chloride channel homolog